MNYIEPDIRTLCIAQSLGNATLLLAGGTKGKRAAMPNAKIQTAPPRLNRGFGTSVEMQIRAKEMEYVAAELGLIDEVMKMDTGKTVVSAFWENALFKYTKDDEKRDARLKKYEELGREEVERANRGMEEFGLVEDRVERGPPRSSP